MPVRNATKEELIDKRLRVEEHIARLKEQLEYSEIALLDYDQKILKKEMEEESDA